ncbi:MAG: hypothetical protein Q4B99_00065 [Clostridia bacterium]|nr:hypothetical protein [Clostridia bacterium]
MGDIVERINAGDREALREFLTRMAGDMYAAAFELLGDKEAALAAVREAARTARERASDCPGDAREWALELVRDACRRDAALPGDATEAEPPALEYEPQDAEPPKRRIGGREIADFAITFVLGALTLFVLWVTLVMLTERGVLPDFLGEAGDAFARWFNETFFELFTA